jgi:hypothetical protein
MTAIKTPEKENNSKEDKKESVVNEEEADRPNLPEGEKECVEEKTYGQEEMDKKIDEAVARAMDAKEIKEELKGTAPESEVPGPWCPSCLQEREGAKGEMLPSTKVTMTKRAPDTLECPKCNTHTKLDVQMTKEARKAALTAQLAALEAEQ